MASFNKIIIVGHLGRDPELRYTPQGDAVCNFSVATSEKRKDQAGEPQEVTTWFQVTAWRRLAELANQYLAKGRQVYIEGKLSQEEFTGRDGNRHTVLKVNASDIHFLGTRGEEPTSPSIPSNQAPKSTGRPESDKETETDHVSDDDIPF